MRRWVCIVLVVGFLILGAEPAYAHQPRLITGEETVTVERPHISQAFYAVLKGRPHVYEIHAREDLHLYVGLLLPDLPGVEKGFTVRVYPLDAQEGEPLLRLDGESSTWSRFFEPFAGDRYWKGPEAERNVPPGTYRIEVSKADNRGKYVLAIGKEEAFTLSDVIHTLRVLPALKVKFFGKRFLMAYVNLVGLFMLLFVTGVFLLGLGILYGVRWFRRSKG